MGLETGNIGFAIRKLDHDIHEFVWTSPSREAVDVWAEFNELLYITTTTDETLRFIHVAQTKKFPPLSYIVRKARELQEKFPEQPSTRSAILFESTTLGGFVNTLSTMLNRSGKDLTRCFGKDQREEAIKWLLSDAPD